MDYRRIKKLVEHLKKGQKEYFDEFYNITKSSVFYVVRKMIFEDDLIKDIMQEAYISFLNNLQKINQNDNPLSYLLTIAKNKTIDELRKNKHYNDDIDVYDFPLEGESDIKDFPLLIYSKYHLTKEEFYILEMSIVLGYKRVEIAKILNQPISTVNWKYNQILKKVKDFYKEVYYEKDE